MMTLLHGDCVEIVPTFPPQSVDAIITDIPYGTTACKWDSIIPFDDLWRIVKHVLKPRGVFVTTASQPLTSALVMSNPKMFKYCWVWDKKIPSNFANVKYAPLKYHEDVCVFSNGKHNYYPQFRSDVKKPFGKIVAGKSEHIAISAKQERGFGYPKSILEYAKPNNLSKNGNLHPTQKPVALYEYLIKTYTNEGDTVLDICMGSGTTGVACKNTGRNFIGIEKDDKYFEIAKNRIETQLL